MFPVNEGGYVSDSAEYSDDRPRNGSDDQQQHHHGNRAVLVLVFKCRSKKAVT